MSMAARCIPRRYNCQLPRKIQDGRLISRMKDRVRRTNAYPGRDGDFVIDVVRLMSRAARPRLQSSSHALIGSSHSPLRLLTQVVGQREAASSPIRSFATPSPAGYTCGESATKLEEHRAASRFHVTSWLGWYGSWGLTEHRLLFLAVRQAELY